LHKPSLHLSPSSVQQFVSLVGAGVGFSHFFPSSFDSKPSLHFVHTAGSSVHSAQFSTLLLQTHFPFVSGKSASQWHVPLVSLVACAPHVCAHCLSSVTKNPSSHFEHVALLVTHVVQFFTSHLSVHSFPSSLLV